MKDSPRLLWILLAALTIWRLIYIGHVELLPDEAYYYQWSLRPDISYYSKGPGVAAAIWIGTHLFGATEFGVRFLSPLLALGTSLIIYFFARRLYGASVAFWCVLVINVIPMFAAGALLMTIDPLSMFFWMAALYTMWLALERSPAWTWWWPATGALIGLGFLCKWTNAMQLLSIVLLLAFTQRHRRELIRPGLWSLVATFALFTVPPLVWNAQHDWITLGHLSARGGLQRAFRISLGDWFEFLGGHFGAYSPLLFGGLLAGLWWGLARARVHFKPRFLLAFTLPLLVLYFTLALREAGEINWTAPAMLSLCILAVALWCERVQEPGAVWLRRYAVASLVLGIAITLLALDTDMLRRAGIPLPYKLDPSYRLRGWQTTADTVGMFRTEFEKTPAKSGVPDGNARSGERTFLIANNNATAAALAFYLKDKRTEGPGHPPVYIPESPAIENQYSFWPRYDELTDLREIAREVVADTSVPGEIRANITQAVNALPSDERSTTPEAVESWRALVRHLHVARSELSLDESFVEQRGISLFAGRTALYVTDRGEERAPSTIKEGFTRVEMVACIDLERRGLLLRQIRIFACYGYRGLPL